MKRVYISGKISDLPIEEVVAKFSEAEKHLTLMGHEPVNPLNNGLSASEAWEKHMVKDIEMLFSCDAIYLLPCWIKSRGARIEKHIAETTKKAIFIADENGVEIDSAFEKAREIRQIVCEALNVEIHDLRSRNRSDIVAYARQIIANQMTQHGYDQEQTCNFLARDRCTVRNYLVNYSDNLKYDRAFNKLATLVINKLTQANYEKNIS